MENKIVILLFLVVNLFGQQMPKKPPILPLTEDIPFIRCDVCQKASKVLYRSVQGKKNEMKPLKVGEDEILAIVEKICDTDSKYGEWMSKLDIMETKNNGLKLQEHTKLGKCKEECKTVSRSCEETIDDIDTDLGGILWKNDLKLSPFINNVCYSLTSACHKLKKKYVPGKRKDFKFVEMTEKDIEAMNMMRNMRGMPGMPGMELYSPEDLENMREQLGVERVEPKEKAAPQPEQQHFQTQLGFFDTAKAMGTDLINKVKTFFGFGKKTEL